MSDSVQPHRRQPTRLPSLGFTRQEHWSGLPFPSPLVQFNSVQSLTCIWFFLTSWTVALQASLSVTNSQSLLKLMSIKSGMPSNHLILCPPLLLLPSIFPSIRVFSNESVLHIRRPKYWSYSYSISPSNEYSGLISFRVDWFDLLVVQRTLNHHMRLYNFWMEILLFNKIISLKKKKSLLQHHSSKAN